MAVKTHIYWTHGALDKSIRKSNIDGTNRATILDAGDILGNLELDESSGYIYYIRYFTSVSRVNIDGSGDTALYSHASILHGLALDLTNGHIYFGRKQAVSRVDLDGSNYINIITYPLANDSVHHIALDLVNGKVYWTWAHLAKDGEVCRADLDGGNAETLVAEGVDFSPYGIALDVANNKVYWTDIDSEHIKRADLDGANIATLIDLTAVAGEEPGGGLDLDLDTGEMYFGVYQRDPPLDHSRKLDKANLDGTGRTTVWDEDPPLLGSLRGIFLASEASSVAGRWDPRVYPLARTTRRAR